MLGICHLSPLWCRCDPSASGPISYAAFEPARYAIGDTRRFAERMGLIDMAPRGDMTSTGYALAIPGMEYLVLMPKTTTDPFTVTLVAGTYTVEWFSVEGRETVGAADVTVEKTSPVTFSAPFKVPALPCCT